MKTYSWDTVAKLQVEYFSDEESKLKQFITEILADVNTEVPATEDDIIAVHISFNSVGYFAPGNTTGLPENCYPDEGDDERTLDEVHVEIYQTGYTLIRLENPLAEKIYAAYKTEVFEQELE